MKQLVADFPGLVAGYQTPRDPMADIRNLASVYVGMNQPSVAKFQVNACKVISVRSRQGFRKPLRPRKCPCG